MSKKCEQINQSDQLGTEFPIIVSYILVVSMQMTLLWSNNSIQSLTISLPMTIIINCMSLIGKLTSWAIKKMHCFTKERELKIPLIKFDWKKGKKWESCYFVLNFKSCYPTSKNLHKQSFYWPNELKQWNILSFRKLHTCIICYKLHIFKLMYYKEGWWGFGHDSKKHNKISVLNNTAKYWLKLSKTIFCSKTVFYKNIKGLENWQKITIPSKINNLALLKL